MAYILRNFQEINQEMTLPKLEENIHVLSLQSLKNVSQYMAETIKRSTEILFLTLKQTSKIRSEDVRLSISSFITSYSLHTNWKLF